jgi:hypothetical protein
VIIERGCGRTKCISAVGLLFGIVTAMSMETVSTKRKRTYQRKFDHDLAREMYEKGFTYGEIVRHLGNTVSVSAVARVVNPRVRERMAAQTKRFTMSGECIDCGANCSINSPRCKPCADRAREERYITDDNDVVIAIRCGGKCKQWKPPAMFGKSKKNGRGFYHVCRACSTNARRDYRNRHKVPCIYCGTLTLHPRERIGGSGEARCRACYIDHARLHL